MSTTTRCALLFACAELVPSTATAQTVRHNSSNAYGGTASLGASRRATNNASPATNAPRRPANSTSVATDASRRPASELSGKGAVAPVVPATPASPATTLPFDSGTVSGVDDGARSRARLLYDQGAKAYREGRFHEAADAFLSSHRLYPTPQLLFNVAVAYDKLGVESSALSYYRDYLRRVPSASDAEDVKTRINELEVMLAKRGVQQLSVITEPAEALLAIDGTAVGLTPWTGETWPGMHRLSLTRDGQQPIAPTITVQALRAEDFSFKLEPLPPAPPKPIAPPPPPPPREVSAVTWILLGVGTAALGTTLVSEMAAKNSSGLTRTGAFFGGVGLTASLVGGVLLHLDLHEPDASPLQKARAITASASGQF